MSNIDDALRALLVERDERRRRLDELESIIKKIQGLSEGAVPAVRGTSVERTPTAGVPELTSVNGTTRSAILELLNSNPVLTFNADEVTDALLDSGWSSTSATPRRIVASTLSSMVRSGAIAKDGPSGYRAVRESDRETDEALLAQLERDEDRYDEQAEADARAEAQIEQYERRLGN
ncbi:hypothetical protein [Amnibacterium kyonggiense]